MSDKDAMRLGAVDPHATLPLAPERSDIIARPTSLIVERLKRRDERAFEWFFREHRGALAAYFRGPRHWHESFVPDLVQETFTRAVSSVHNFRGHNEAQAHRWLFGIARNVHLQEVTRQVGIRLRQDVALQLARLLPRTAEASWYRQDIVEALEQLPLGQLEVLRLVLEGLTIRQIAEELGIPAGTVANRIHRARHRLRTRLDISEQL
ncbi:MAG: RNA polymerase sigma factor [Myxococcota bacterium]